jgi:hypothetical protein
MRAGSAINPTFSPLTNVSTKPDEKKKKKSMYSSVVCNYIFIRKLKEEEKSHTRDGG